MGFSLAETSLFFFFFRPAGGALDPPEGSRQPEAICLWGENSPLHPAQEAVEPQLLPVPPQVSSFYHTIPSLLQQLQAEALQFEGGRLQQFYAVWETLTSDPEILQLVSGAHLQFDDTEFPSSSSPQPHLNKSEMAITDAEIVKLSRRKKKKKKKMISKCEHSPDQYLSPVFTRPKKDGTNRMILNLKGLNSEIT